MHLYFVDRILHSEHTTRVTAQKKQKRDEYEDLYEWD